MPLNSKKQALQWWSVWIALLLGWLGVCLWLLPQSEAAFLARLDDVGVKREHLEGWHAWQDLVRANFVHLSWEHLSINALALFLALLIWRRLPAHRDGVWLASLWLCAGVGGFLCSSAWGGLYSAGASAGIHGVFGALAWRLSTWVRIDPRAWLLLVPTIALLLLSLSDGATHVDHLAHLGGMLVGLGLAALQRSGRANPHVLVCVALALLMFGYLPRVI